MVSREFCFCTHHYRLVGFHEIIDHGLGLKKREPFMGINLLIIFHLSLKYYRIFEWLVKTKKDRPISTAEEEEVMGKGVYLA